MAVDQGVSLAQYEVGILYSLGQGVPLDNVSEYMWMSLASGGMERGSDRAREMGSTRDRLRKARRVQTDERTACAI
jgi:TPR repeat protein